MIQLLVNFATIPQVLQPTTKITQSFANIPFFLFCFKSYPQKYKGQLNRMYITGNMT